MRSDRESAGDTRGADAGGPAGGSRESLLASYTSHRRVAAFLLRVILRVLPDVFLGSRRAGANRALYEKLLLFVRLGRYDTLTAEALAKNMRAAGPRSAGPHLASSDSRRLGAAWE